MVVENKMDKLCCFYVSDFHLEMILLPYINKKLDESIIIETEKDLRDSVKTVISKMNLSNESKEKILKLGWNSREKQKIEDKSNVIVIGTKKYIDDVNEKIKQEDIKDVTIIDCYDFEQTKEKMEYIINNYSLNLNTNGLNSIKKQ